MWNREGDIMVRNPDRISIIMRIQRIPNPNSSSMQVSSSSSNRKKSGKPNWKCGAREVALLFDNAVRGIAGRDTTAMIRCHRKAALEEVSQWSLDLAKPQMGQRDCLVEKSCFRCVLVSDGPTSVKSEPQLKTPKDAWNSCTPVSTLVSAKFRGIVLKSQDLSTKSKRASIVAGQEVGHLRHWAMERWDCLWHLEQVQAQHGPRPTLMLHSAYANHQKV